MSNELTLTADGSRVIIETTNTVNGCLEQGGVCGKRVSYPAADVARVLGIEVSEIELYDTDDEAPGRDCTVGQALAHELGEGHIIRRGELIA